MRIPFAVGKVTARVTEVVLVAQRGECPLPGPWVLCGLVDVRRIDKQPA